MRVKLSNDTDVNFTELRLKCGVRYWEDATVNGIEDTEGSLIPFREGDYWCPMINIDKGTIENWPIGTTADIHYKVCDDGEYWIITDTGRERLYRAYYVPAILDLYEESFGDYVIMKVDESGKIQDWNIRPKDIIEFLEAEE